MLADLWRDIPDPVEWIAVRMSRGDDVNADRTVPADWHTVLAALHRYPRHRAHLDAFRLECMTFSLETPPDVEAIAGIMDVDGSIRDDDLKRMLRELRALPKGLESPSGLCVPAQFAAFDEVFEVVGERGPAGDRGRSGRLGHRIRIDAAPACPDSTRDCRHTIGNISPIPVCAHRSLIQCEERRRPNEWTD